MVVPFQIKKKFKCSCEFEDNNKAFEAMKATFQASLPTEKLSIFINAIIVAKCTFCGEYFNGESTEKCEFHPESSAVYTNCSPFGLYRCCGAV